MLYDVIIVGAGPAGSACAYDLSKYGLSALFFDKYKFPRYKACGGFISKKILPALPFDISEIVEKTAATCGLTYKSADGFKINLPEPIGFLVSRSKFDLFLAEKAALAGASFKQDEKVIDFRRENNVYRVITDKDEYRAKYLIGADGANSIVRKKSRLAQKVRNYFTLTAELKSGKDEFDDTAWFDLGDVPYGYGWVFPKTDHVTLGFGLFYNARRKKKKDPRIYMYDFHRKNKLVNKFNLGKMRGCFISTLIDERSKICGKGLFLAGEAAGLVDPFSGEGIYYAAASGKILARALRDNFDNEEEAELIYKNKVREEILSEFKVAEKLAKVIYTFPKLSFQILRDYKHLSDYYCRLLGGGVSYSDLYERLIDKVKKRVKTGFTDMFSFLGKN